MADEPAPASPPDRSHWVVRKCASYEEMELWHLWDWQQAGSAARLRAAWEMVVEAWALKKRNPDELRFQRLVTSIKRA